MTAPKPPFAVESVLSTVYLVSGVLAMVGAVLHLVAGWRNFHFRGRRLGLVALSWGLLTLFTCYCFPSAMGLFIYGLIVYLNGQSVRWFALGDKGATPDVIQTTW